MDPFTMKKLVDFKDDKETLEVVVDRPGPDDEWLKLNTIVGETGEKIHLLPTREGVTKGFVLILNIMKFHGAAKRTGSDNDVEYLTDLFTELDYKIFLETTKERYQEMKTKEDVHDMLRKFVRACEMSRPPSIIVFIGSHGEHPFKIRTSSKRVVDTYIDLFADIVGLFTPKNCTGLEGIPKIFVIQACQGAESSGAPDQIRGSDSHPSVGNPGSSSLENALADYKARINEPILDDILICTATTPGELANRDMYKGSWFVYCFTCMMMRHALHAMSFQEIMGEVKAMMEQIQGEGVEAKQVPQVAPANFSKLYFWGKPDGENKLEKLQGENPVNAISLRRQFKNTVPKHFSYYVERKIISRNYISTEVLKAKELSDIFLITGNITVKGLNIICKSSADSSENQLSQAELTVRHIILEREEDFDQICEKAHKSVPVHFLHYEGDHAPLRRIRSKGEISNLREFVVERSVPLEEEDLCSHVGSESNEPICISDSPGMGKTVLLAMMGRRLRRLYPRRLVVFVIFSEFIRQIGRMNGSTEANLQAVLKETLCNSDASRGSTVLESMLSSEQVSIELLLDGFDEVDDPDSAIELMEKVRASYKSVRMWITTRPHDLEELETKLIVLGYNIQPFDLGDQLNFLTNFWSREYKLDDTRNLGFAKHLITNLKDKMKDKDNEDIAGIPLQCFLIAIVFEVDAKKYSKLESTEPLAIKIVIDNTGTLYKEAMRFKLNNYKVAYGTPILILSEDELRILHAKLGLALLFPNTYKKICKELPDAAQLQEVLNVGIVEGSHLPIDNHPPRFIHRTFAEFSVGWFVFHSMTKKGAWNKAVSKFFLNEVLCRGQTKPKKFLHTVINYFLDSWIADISIPRDISEGASAALRKASSINTPNTLPEVTGACGSADYVNILSLFIKLGTFDKHSKQVFTRKFLIDAAQKYSLEYFKLIFPQFDQSELDEDMKTNLFGAAVRGGHPATLKYLFYEENWSGLAATLKGNCKYLLLECIKNSKSNSEKVIGKKDTVIELLVATNKELLEQTYEEFNETPLVLGLRDDSKCHMRLLTKMIDLGADIFHVNDENGNTIIHFDFEKKHLSAQERYALLASIPEWKLMTVGIKRFVTLN